MLGLIGPMVKALLIGELDTLLSNGFHTSIREHSHTYNVGAVEVDADENTPLIASTRDAGELIGLVTVAAFEAAFEGNGAAVFSIPTPGAAKGDAKRKTFRVSVERI